ncbi:SDR family oxidoreductase [Shivajiella indica]|uniref:SDR family oxidoreductase n=1 Tax=Shivajiella indica TaxID=872115 RepID=A0ABW5BAH8_9BACT
MVKSFNLKNKVVLVTGGYGHLGKAIVDSLLYHEAKVYVLGRDKEKFIQKFKEKLENLRFTYCDVSDLDSVKKAFSNIYQSEARLDVLINNAFYSRGQSPEEMNDEDFLYGLEGTLGSIFKCTREIIPYFKKQGFGKIINVSSMYGVVAPDFRIYDETPAYLNPPHYGAAKAGVIQLTKYYASYLGKYNIQVNVVTPGPFPSENVQKDTSFIKKLSEKTLVNRIGKPEDLAGVFVFLSSDAADFITGQNIIVDGGWTVR